MPDHALKFMAERKGVGCWVGPETQPETGSMVSSTCVHRKLSLPTVLRGGSSEAGCVWSKMLSTVPECTVTAAACQPQPLWVLLFSSLSFFFPFFLFSSSFFSSPELGSHGFWSILKRLCHYWPGQQTACSKAISHFFPQSEFVQMENTGNVDTCSLLPMSFKHSVHPLTPISSTVLTRNNNLLPN